MGNILVIALLSITALLLPMAGTEYKPAVEVIRVTSPDTFKAYSRRQETDVKLIGVSVPDRPSFDNWVNSHSFTPEEKAALYEQYRQAESFLQERIHRGDKLTIEYDMKRNDNSGRLLAYVYLPDGRTLNEMMIQAGLAYPEVDPDNVRRMQAYTGLYNTALRNQQGLWRYYSDTTGPTVFNPPPKQQSWFSASADSLNPSQQSFTFMVYNVENLFDTAHDPGKMDRQYMPLSEKTSEEHIGYCKSLRFGQDECLKLDWSEATLSKKMERLAAVIKSVNSGQGPDILVLAEVENMNVLQKLASGPLASCNYKTMVLFEGGDPRGIDLAMLSRFPIKGEPRMIPIKFRRAHSSRDIMQVDLVLPDESELTVFGLHFPSQAAPWESRQDAADFLADLVDDLPEGRMYIAAGDCNITSSEEAQHNLIGRYDDDWAISYRLGCKNAAGSHYYRERGRSADDPANWSFLDIVLFPYSMTDSGEQKASWVVDPDSILVHNTAPYQKEADGTPARFKWPQMDGVSDHWPVIATFNKR